MVAAVQADLVTGRGNVRKCIRKLRDAISADKKSRVYLPLGQSLQKLLGQFARRPVVERQRHDAPRRPVAAQAADIRPQPDLVGAVEKGEPRGDYGDNYIHVNSMADTVLPGKSL